MSSEELYVCSQIPNKAEKSSFLKIIFRVFFVLRVFWLNVQLTLYTKLRLKKHFIHLRN